MSALVILLLAALWAAILLPAALRARREHHPVASADGFARAMTTLAGRQRSSRRMRVPRGVAALLRRLPRTARLRELLAPPATPAARRRRAILTGLVAVLAFAVVLGAVVGGLAWLLAGVIGAALAGYLGLVFVFVVRAGAAQRTRRDPSAEASATRAAAVRAAVARPAVGDASPAPRPPDRPLDQVATGGLAPVGERAAVPAGGPSAVSTPRGAGAAAGGGVAAGGARASGSIPRITKVSGDAGLVSIRTLPRAGG